MTYYDEISSGYEELHKEEQLKKIKLISEHLKVSKEDKLLDVGCGTGLTTEPWDCKRYGIDPALKLLERARNKDKIEYKLAPAEKIPYEDNFFDIVISITAIQNFEDIEKGLKEIKRVGKDKFVLSFLKKSSKREFIDGKIKKIFNIMEIIEEEKDMIYFAKKASGL
ncbi:class I SAM-dependent methyltransferase [Candidatus Woesearchaeota archaeon]|nr:class I SAM-dependent methyltransferase [Candidatus Woesearchaeota archaeon]